MTIRILPSSEVRDHMAEVIRSFKESDAPCYITQHGRAAAVLLPVYRFEALMSLLEELKSEHADQRPQWRTHEVIEKNT